jgi:hypothetical protein
VRCSRHSLQCMFLGLVYTWWALVMFWVQSECNVKNMDGWMSWMDDGRTGRDRSRNQVEVDVWRQ